jgi:hypothetical protein
MSDPPLKTERAGSVTAASPKDSELADHSPLICGAQDECSHEETRVAIEPSGSVHFAREICSNCDRVLRFLPKRATVEPCRLNGYRLARLAMCNCLPHWERNFVRGVSGRNKLSLKQQAIIDRLSATYLK